MEDASTRSVRSFRRTLELSPPVLEGVRLLGSSLNKLGGKTSGQGLSRGIGVAEERGDNMRADEMARFLVELASSRRNRSRPQSHGRRGGFRCQRPAAPRERTPTSFPSRRSTTSWAGRFTTASAPIADYWLRNLSIKSHQRMRLDLSTSAARNVRSDHA